MKYDDIKLTQYSHGAGCGCKISPAILDSIIQSTVTYKKDAHLLVGNDHKDDAAVYDLGDGTALISTTDFFMPIVDNPFDFGRIAAANAISDIYAMGGRPILSIAILGWPIDKLAPEVAQQVIEGAREICNEAGIAIAGGHSIDAPEPIFGLAVNGLVDIADLKENSKAMAGCKLYLTKALGIGALSTAQKAGVLTPEDADIALKSMTSLNKVGAVFAKLSGVRAMTDVTGFGLLGHLSEICEGSGISAVVEFDKVPVIPSLHSYLDQGCIPGGTHRNWASYGDKIGELSERQQLVLTDPQTSGGLLVVVEDSFCDEFEAVARDNGFNLSPIGYTTEKGDVLVEIK